MNNPNPPKLILQFFRWFCHPELRQPIEGDLMELYDERLNEVGKRKADLYFTKDVFLLFRPNIIKPAEGTHSINHYGMFKNYFKVGLRNILKYKLFSFINIFGLSVAMSICMFIILLLVDQKNYDQFNTKKDHIYRILGTPYQGSNAYATTAFPLINALSTDYPIIEDAAMLRRGVGGDISVNNKSTEVRGYFTDNSFLNLFDFKLIKGDRNTALSQSNGIIISSEKAYHLFNTENPIGKTIQFDDRGLNMSDAEQSSAPVDWGIFTVVGVIDMKAHKSHLKFDVLLSSKILPSLIRDEKRADMSNDWKSHYICYNYILLDKKSNKNELDFILSDLSKRQYTEIPMLEGYKLESQNLNDITPGGLINNESSIRIPEFGYYILSGLAFIIMLMACLNYTNLSIARSLTRMKEIGVRKVNGATRKNLIFQFLTESVITVLLSLILSCVILYFIKEAFMNFWFNQFLGLDLQSSSLLYLVYVAFALLVGISAGIYPAFFLSKKKPVSALKNNNSITVGKWGLQSFLSVSQFVFSLIFIVTAIVIYNQFKHFTNFDYGFDSRNIVNIPIQGNDYDLLTSEIATIPGIDKISASDYIPATGTSNAIDLINPRTDEDLFNFLLLRTDGNFLEVLGLNLLAGENLSEKSIDKNHVIINEVAAKKLGFDYPNEAIGTSVKVKDTNKILKISGVVENFRASLLVNGNENRPLVIQKNYSSLNYLNIKISAVNPAKTISSIETTWKNIDPIHGFKYKFLDFELANTMIGLKDIATIVGYLSFMAIIISCLGLLGIATYSTERKKKEVGIRKVLGAGTFKILLMLSKRFMILILIAIAIAAPLSYILNNLWLENIANRVNLEFDTILFGSLLLLILGLITIGSQTLYASQKNPIESLKSE